MKKNVSYHMKKLNLPGIEKWLGTFDSLGQTFDSSGECFASLRSEKQLSPLESKVCPLESKVCLTIFPSLASIFHVVGTYKLFLVFLLQIRKTKQNMDAPKCLSLIHI